MLSPQWMTYGQGFCARSRYSYLSVQLGRGCTRRRAKRYYYCDKERTLAAYVFCFVRHAPPVELWHSVFDFRVI